MEAEKNTLQTKMNVLNERIVMDNQTSNYVSTNR